MSKLCPKCDKKFVKKDIYEAHIEICTSPLSNVPSQNREKLRTAMTEISDLFSYMFREHNAMHLDRIVSTLKTLNEMLTDSDGNTIVNDGVKNIDINDNVI